MFIAIEGSDGVGKGTQAKLLVKYFKDLGKDVLYLDFPAYESRIGKEIGLLLSSTDEEHNASTIPPKIMSMLYALDRVQFKDDINNALINNKVVIANRYVMSSVVFQTARGNAELADWIYHLEHNSLAMPLPDCYVVLLGDVEVSQKAKREQRRDYTDSLDVYEADTHLLNKTVELYKNIRINGSSVLRVECCERGAFKSKDIVFKEVLRQLVAFIKE